MARSSQSQRQASQSQPRGKRGKRVEEPEVAEEEEQEEEEENEDNGDVDMDGNGGGVDSEITRKASDLVRLALFTEHRRTPLRRDEISKKVLGSNSRAFNAVLAQAQLMLNTTFGMELVELRARAAADETEGDRGTKGVEQARKATGVKKKAVSTGSKTYILRSILDARIIEHAALTDEQILEQEAEDSPDDDDDDDDEDLSYGSLLSWSTADHLGALGVLHVVLALILVNGRVISDMDLRQHLKRLRLPGTALLTLNPRSTHKTLALDAYLPQLVRQGYLDRTRIGDGGKKPGGKRGRASQGGDDGLAAAYEWRWGPRAAGEVGELRVAEFVAEFMVERERDAEGSEGGRRAGDEQRKRLERVMKGVERAAGGGLSDVK